VRTADRRRRPPARRAAGRGRPQRGYVGGVVAVVRRDSGVARPGAQRSAPARASAPGDSAPAPAHGNRPPRGRRRPRRRGRSAVTVCLDGRGRRTCRAGIGPELAGALRSRRGARDGRARGVPYPRATLTLSIWAPPLLPLAQDPRRDRAAQEPGRRVLDRRFRYRDRKRRRPVQGEVGLRISTARRWASVRSGRCSPRSPCRRRR
jgi:hypothetical protein